MGKCKDIFLKCLYWCLYLCCCCCCCEDFVRKLFYYIANIGKNVKGFFGKWISILISKLKAFKDQIMFVVFSLGMYIVDIGTDVRQAFDYFKLVKVSYLSMFRFNSQVDILNRKGHPKRAFMTIFWVFCPMLVKLILDIANRMKKHGFSFGLCGCGACKVSFVSFFNINQITQKPK